MTKLEQYTPLRRRLLAYVSNNRSEAAVKYWWRHYLHLCSLCNEADYQARRRQHV